MLHKKNLNIISSHIYSQNVCIERCVKSYSLFKSHTWKPDQEYHNSLLKRNDHCVHSHFQYDKSIGLKLFIGIKKLRGGDVGLGLLIFLDLLLSSSCKFSGKKDPCKRSLSLQYFGGKE